MRKMASSEVRVPKFALFGKPLGAGRRKVRRRVKKPRVERPRRVQVIGFFSCKGGVGKTTVVANVAAALAEKIPGRVLVVDANTSAPNLGLHLGILEPRVSLQEILTGRHSVERAIQLIPDLNLYCLLGVPKLMEERFLDLRKVIDPLREKYDFILVDTSPGLSPEVISALRACDRIFVVVAPELPTLASVLQTLRIADEHGIPVEGVILNKFKKRRYYLEEEKVPTMLGYPVCISIPEDERVHESLWVQEPVVKYNPNSKAARKFAEFANQILQKFGTSRLSPQQPSG